MKPIDLRSDTVTRPTAAMRQAMVEAPVGDDVFGEDPTVNQLEARMAELLGKESALFVTSGTMANQLAIRCQTRPGDAIALEHRAHPYRYEAGGAAMLSGVTCRPLHSDRGRITPALVARWIVPDDPHLTPLRLVCVENTHNASGGAVIGRDHLEPLLRFCSEHRLTTHLDGARLFNAATALDCSVGALADGFDSVSVCFSKGLGAPVGSVLAGSAEMIALARRMRKAWGGGWRQAGMLAAAALYALDYHLPRLADDHRRARALGDALSRLDGFNAEPVDSNMVLLNIGNRSAADLVQQLAQRGVQCFDVADNRLRLVLHLAISDADVEQTIAAFRSL